jgi:hypothetical protein
MAQYEELYIEQGSTFQYIITLSNPSGGAFDLTSYTARSQLKRSYKSVSAIDFTITYPNRTGGQIQLNLTDEITALLKYGNYVFDVVIESSSGEIYRVIEGIAFVDPGVTE